MEKKNERAPQMGFPQMTLRDYFAAISRAVMAAADFILTRNAEAAEVKQMDVVGLFNARNAKDFGA